MLRYLGATAHTLRLVPFAGWHAEQDQLHVFCGLPHNGERPGGCQVIEDDQTAVVTLSIKDWRGAKTLIGGFTPAMRPSADHEAGRQPRLRERSH